MAKPQLKKAVDTNIKTDLPTLRQPEKFMERTEQISWSELAKQIEAETETFEREIVKEAIVEYFRNHPELI